MLQIFKLSSSGYASVNWPNKDFFNAEHVIELLSGRLQKWDYSNLDVSEIL